MSQSAVKASVKPADSPFVQIDNLDGLAAGRYQLTRSAAFLPNFVMPENCTLDLNGLACEASGGNGVTVTTGSSLANGLLIADGNVAVRLVGQGAVVEDVDIAGPAENGICFDSATQAIAENCRIQVRKRYGIFFRGTSANILIGRNHVLGSLDESCIRTTADVRDLTVTGNFCATANDKSGIRINRGTRICVLNNVIMGGDLWIGSVNDYEVVDVDVSGNYVESTGHALLVRTNLRSARIHMNVLWPSGNAIQGQPDASYTDVSIWSNTAYLLPAGLPEAGFPHDMGGVSIVDTLVLRVDQ